MRTNLCRNPDNEKTIWCYTTNPKVRWQYCTPLGIRRSPRVNVESYTRALNGSDYRGFQTKTRSGRTCQRWDRQSPQKHSRRPQFYPLSGLDRNYCRNPDSAGNIWCYTTDRKKRWEYCNPLTRIRKYKKSERLAGYKDNKYRGIQSKTNGGWAC